MHTAGTPDPITARAAYEPEATARPADLARPGNVAVPEERALQWIFLYATGALFTLIELSVATFQAAPHWWQWPWRLLVNLVLADLWPVYWLLLR